MASAWLQAKVRELEDDLAEARKKNVRDSEASTRAVSRAKMHAAELSEELEASTALAEEREQALKALEVLNIPDELLSLPLFLSLCLFVYTFVAFG